MNRSFSLAYAGAMAIMVAHSATAQSTSNSAPMPAHTPMSVEAADNTKANQTDSTKGEPTADSQREDSKDLTLTQRIRQQVMADKSLSTDAHNVKIISVNGMVTLNGVVKSEREKTSIEIKAQSVAGKTQVVNDLTIAPST